LYTGIFKKLSEHQDGLTKIGGRGVKPPSAKQIQYCKLK